MIKRFLKKACALLPHVTLSVGLILGGQVFAVDRSSDGGEILRQIERDLEKINPPRTPPVIEQEKKEEIKKTGPTFKVQNFLFEGNQLISSSELEKASKEKAGDQKGGSLGCKANKKSNAQGCQVKR